MAYNYEVNQKEMEKVTLDLIQNLTKKTLINGGINNGTNK